MKGGKHRNGHAMTSVYRYDPIAREITCDFGGATNVYRYDADGKLLAVSIPGEGWATYLYNALGQNDAVTLPGGTRRALAYDAFGRLASQSAVDGGGNALLAQAYGRSLTGRLETKTTDAGTWRYGYDLTDQVTNAVLAASGSADGAWGYSYDAMGNRTQSAIGNGQSADVTAYSASNLNQYTAISNGQWAISSPTYDLNGNMTWDGTNAYFWDLQNQLVLVSNAAVQVASAYDAMGRRVKKIVSRRDAETQSWEVESTRHFFYDGWNVIRETIHSTLPSFQSSTNLYTWGNDLSGTLQGAGGVGGLLAVLSSGSQPYSLTAYYPLFDHNGNVERYVARNGATVAAFQYDAFGNTVSETFTQSGIDALTHFRFSTKYWDAETGLYYYGYRFYCPRLGRWMRRDPIEEYGGWNLHGFEGNNAVNTYDGFGLFGSGQRYAKSHGFNIIAFGISLNSLFEGRVPLGHSDFIGADFFDFVKEDIDPFTSPYNPIMAGNHFQELEYSKKQAQEAMKECPCNKPKFERALHRVQDFRSHREKGYEYKPFLKWKNLGFGHIFAGFFGDEPDDDEDGWNKAEEDTVKLVNEWDANPNCAKRKP